MQFLHMVLLVRYSLIFFNFLFFLDNIPAISIQKGLIRACERWSSEGHIIQHDNAIIVPAIKVILTHHTNYLDSVAFIRFPLYLMFGRMLSYHCAPWSLLLRNDVAHNLHDTTYEKPSVILHSLSFVCIPRVSSFAHRQFAISSS